MYVLGPYFSIFKDPTLFWAWDTLLGHNQCWKSKFEIIDIHFWKFQIMLSRGLLMTFLILEFDLKSFSTLLGPNDPKKVKKL